MANILFLAPHPDDESIFAGGTIKKLVEQGHNVHLVFATNGALGIGGKNMPLEIVRRREALAAAKVLGVPAGHCYFLGYEDSGLDTNNLSDNAFAKCDLDEASNKLITIINYATGITDDPVTLVCDPPNGIYGHPDHIRSHMVGVKVKDKQPNIDLLFMTVDREDMHFLETKHVVQTARAAFELEKESNKNSKFLDWVKNKVRRLINKPVPLNRLADFGSETVEITYCIDSSDESLIKREAIAQHQSQIGPKSRIIRWLAPKIMRMDEETFKRVYGPECFVRYKTSEERIAIKEALATGNLNALITNEASPFDSLPQRSIPRTSAEMTLE